MRGRTCTTSPSSIAPRRHAGNSVWDGNLEARRQRTKVHIFHHLLLFLIQGHLPGGHQSWPAVEFQKTTLNSVLGVNIETKPHIELQKTSLNSVLGENLVNLHGQNENELES